MDRTPTLRQKFLAELLGTAFLVWVGPGSITTTNFISGGKVPFTMAELGIIALAFACRLGRSHHRSDGGGRHFRLWPRHQCGPQPLPCPGPRRAPGALRRHVQSRSPCCLLCRSCRWWYPRCPCL